MFADLYFPEPHLDRPLLSAFLLLVALLVATAVAAIVHDILASRETVAGMQARAERARMMPAPLPADEFTGRHASPLEAADTGYVGRRYADTDAPTRVLCRADGSWRA